MLETITLQKSQDTITDLPIAAILLDPSASKILISTHDTRTSSNHPLNHTIMNLLNSLPSLPDRPSEEQYYASTYDVYITHEPCLMCCMALIHSRIRRLVFWRKMPKTGGSKIGWMKVEEDEGCSLNHRFMCFEGISGGLGKAIEVGEIDDDVYV